jgi:hypothetical protein
MTFNCLAITGPDTIVDASARAVLEAVPAAGRIVTRAEGSVTCDFDTERPLAPETLIDLAARFPSLRFEYAYVTQGAPLYGGLSVFEGGYFVEGQDNVEGADAIRLLSPWHTDTLADYDDN